MMQENKAFQSRSRTLGRWNICLTHTLFFVYLNGGLYLSYLQISIENIKIKPIILGNNSRPQVGDQCWGTCFVYRLLDFWNLNKYFSILHTPTHVPFPVKFPAQMEAFRPRTSTVGKEASKQLQRVEISNDMMIFGFNYTPREANE